MLGGYNIDTLISLLEDQALGGAADQLKNIVLVYDAFHDVVALASKGVKTAESVLNSWANADGLLLEHQSQSL